MIKYFSVVSQKAHSTPAVAVAIPHEQADVENVVLLEVDGVFCEVDDLTSGDEIGFVVLATDEGILMDFSLGDFWRRYSQCR
jgi:hypothetical protein